VYFPIDKKGKRCQVLQCEGRKDKQKHVIPKKVGHPLSKRVNA